MEKVNQRNFKNLNETSLKIKDYIESFENREESPYQQAVRGLKSLKELSKNPDEELLFLTQDIINTALSTTIIEELLNTIRAHQDVALQLIEKFSDSSDERDLQINSHTMNHLNYIRSNGECSGCTSCEGHDDIAPLISPWMRKNNDFFKRLYLEVQTIYCALERVLYEYIPKNPEIISEINTTTLNELREYLATNIHKKIHTM